MTACKKNFKDAPNFRCPDCGYVFKKKVYQTRCLHCGETLPTYTIRDNKGMVSKHYGGIQ